MKEPRNHNSSPSESVLTSCLALTRFNVGFATSSAPKCKRLKSNYTSSRVPRATQDRFWLFSGLTGTVCPVRRTGKGGQAVP